MNEFIKGRAEKVREWRAKNVQRFEEPNQVTLSEFNVDWNDFSGDFKLSIGNIVLEKKIKFELEASGRTIFCRPMFHSPHGTPWSYAAIDITENTSKAITMALRKTFPRLQGAGIDRETGKEIYFSTHPRHRISPGELEKAVSKVSKDYAVTIEIKPISSDI
jgi:hypothetical protein